MQIQEKEFVKTLIWIMLRRHSEVVSGDRYREQYVTEGTRESPGADLYRNRKQLEIGPLTVF